MSAFKDLLSIDEPSGERFDLAMDLLAAGRGILFRGLALGVENDTLIVEVPSSWIGQNITPYGARRDLESAKSIISELEHAAPRFREIVRGRGQRLLLVDDYGMGRVVICELQGGELKWTPEYAPIAPT